MDINKQNDQTLEEPKQVFYSREWRKQQLTFISSGKPLDMMIDGNFLYIIEPPAKKTASRWTAFFSWALSSGAAALALSNSAESIDEKKREEYRQRWVTPDNKLVSEEYENYVILKVPVSELKNSISFGWSGVNISHNGKRFTLTRRRKSDSLMGPSKKPEKELRRYLNNNFGIDIQGKSRRMISVWSFVFLLTAAVIVFFILSG